MRFVARFGILRGCFPQREIPRRNPSLASAGPVLLAEFQPLPAWNNLRLENRSELIGPSCGAQPILPLRKARGRRWVKKAGKLLCSETSVVNAYVNRSWLYADTREPTPDAKP